MSRSHLLEHLVRAVLLLLSRTAGTRHEAESQDELQVSVQNLWMSLRFLTVCRGASEPRVARLACRLLSGPCMQHLLLLHVVAQLGAADGGPRYGLPPGAELPVLYFDPVTRNPAPPPSGDAARAAPARPLATEGLIHIVDLWLFCFTTGKDLPRPPVPARALRALCVRLADAAAETMEAARAARSGGGGGTGSGRSTAARPRLERRDCVALAQRAMTCAIATAADASRPELMAGLWRAIVRTVDNSFAERMVQERGDVDGLLELLRPRFSVLLTPEASLPLRPPRDLAAALSAGYVSRLERTLRFVYCGSGMANTDVPLSEVFETFKEFSPLAGLWAYGEPRCVAALMATGAKMLRRATAALAGLLPGARAAVMREFAGLYPQLDTVSGSLHWLETYHTALSSAASPCEYGLWWRRRAVGGAGGGGAAAAAPQSDPAGASSSGAGAGAGASGSGSGDITREGDAAARTLPFRRLATMVTFSMSRWLPAMACNALALRDAALVSAGVDGQVAFILATALAGSVLSCSNAMCVAYVTTTGIAVGGEAQASAEAASWRRLLLQELDMFGLIRVQIDLIARYRQRAASAAATKVGLLLPSLTYLVTTFPEEAQTAFAAPLPAAGSGSGAELGPLDGMSALGALQVLVEELLGPQGLAQYARHLVLMHRVCVGGRLTQSEVAAVSRGGLVGSAPWPHALPPPCVAAARLQLRLCGNVECTNLAGESEAELPLNRCGGGCGGAVAYCSRDCQRADWKAGHKNVCGPVGQKAGGKAQEAKG